MIQKDWEEKRKLSHLPSCSSASVLLPISPSMNKASPVNLALLSSYNKAAGLSPLWLFHSLCRLAQINGWAGGGAHRFGLSRGGRAERGGYYTWSCCPSEGLSAQAISPSLYHVNHMCCRDHCDNQQRCYLDPYKWKWACWGQVKIHHQDSG